MSRVEPGKSIVHLTEDDPAVRDAIEVFLGTVGVDVHSYATAAEFLSDANPSDIRFLVIDVDMPAFDGIDLLDRLRDAGITAPAVFTTSGNYTAGLRAAAARTGAHVLLKPYAPEELIARIRTAFDASNSHGGGPLTPERRLVPRRLLPLALPTAIAALLLTVVNLAAPPVPANSAKIVIFAAASLQGALDDAVSIYRDQSGDTVTVSYAASSTLAKQIESGTPADLFISADLDWMDYLQQLNLIRPATRRNFLGNKLVIAEPAGSAVSLDIKPGFDLVGVLKDGNLAMADPDTVPAGKYGRGALQKLGVWNAVEGKIVRAPNVRAALRLVGDHEAPLGIVYATDISSDPGVKITAVFPETSHPPIIYPIAVTTSSQTSTARRLLEFLGSPPATAAFEKRGFMVLQSKASLGEKR